MQEGQPKMPEPIVILAIISALLGLWALGIAMRHGFRMEREKHLSGEYRHERRAPRS